MTTADHSSRTRTIPWWVVTTYFAEGFPYSVVRQISTVFFKDAGASLQAIGLTSLYGLPWTIKFLWAPLVDTFATKRRWLLAAEATLVGLLVLLAAATGLPSALPAAAVVFFVLAIVSATHDIAIDGYYLEALDRTDQARYVGFQAMSYRLALIAGGGGVIAFSGLTSWPAAFGLAAGILGTLFTIHVLFLPVQERTRRPAIDMFRRLARLRTLTVLLGVAALTALILDLSSRAWFEPVRRILGILSFPEWLVLILLLSMFVLAFRAPALKRKLYASDSTYALAFIDYLDQPRVGLILTFIALYRTGESFLLNMAYPFLRDIGVSRTAYGIAYGTFGISASIIGGLLGGALIARYGLKRCIWPFVLSQNLLNLLYMLMAIKYHAIFKHPELGHADIRLVGGLIVVEAFGSGLGTAAFMVFIMRTARPAFKAAHMAIATGIATVSSTLAGVLSGFLAAALGFEIYFGLTFLATIPAMALIPWLPYLDRARES
ncbi:MAG: AmpG family muropeptide MFS transporter [Acidobacteria bacterium]|nr:AmpG family muropeptide MFS transporter [Acidobacteriota bacterium]